MSCYFLVKVGVRILLTADSILLRAKNFKNLSQNISVKQKLPTVALHYLYLNVASVVAFLMVSSCF